MIRKTIVALAVLTASPALADTLIDDVNGITVDRNGKVTHFAAMVIDDHGRIVQVLDRRDRPPKVDFREDGRGRTVIPGLIDSHVHLMQIGLQALSLDLTGTKSLAEAQDKIRAYAAKFPDRPWIVGSGWNQELWGLGRFPTAAELDAALADRPVWLSAADGHSGWANSRALQLAGITAATSDPAGGRVERIAGGKAPAGVLVDTAQDLLQGFVPPPRPEDLDLALYEAQKILAKHGVTAVADMGTSIEDWQSFRRAGDAGSLQIRIMAYGKGIEDTLLIGGPGPTRWLYDDRLRLNGLALSMDGALASRGAWLKAPYADDPKNTGLQVINGTQLRNLMSRGAMDNFQLAIDATGDAANAEVLSAVEELSGDFTGDRRWRIEHAQVVDPADIQRFGQDGVIASMQPQQQTSGRLTAETRLGPTRLAGDYAWKSIAAAGAPLAFGSDAPVEVPDPFAGLAAAVTRADAQGEPFGGWQPQEAISREAALAAYTAGAAYAGLADGKFGEIKAGQRADFLVLDRDPLVVSGPELHDIRVLQTWIGGVKVYDASPASDERRDPEVGR